ncbi:MAG: LysR family transcriptional regulator [Geminicoccaceae bacterium]
MRAFTAVASEHSFTGAGKRLGLSTKLVSNQVRQLEERLGVRLFDRTTRSVALTDVGRAYFDRCQGLLDQFDELETSVQDRHRRPTGRIRMTAPTSFGERSLTGALALFLEDHPGIRIDLELTNRNVSLVEEGFDLAVRIGDLPDSSMIARRLASMRVVVCAAPAYFRTHGKPETPAALVDHPCIVDTNIGRAPIWPFRVDGRLVDVKVDGPFFVNTPGAACEMALAGIGILLCPFYVAGPCIERGALEILFADQEAIDFGVYTIYPHNRHLTGRVRALVDHLAATLGDH